MVQSLSDIRKGYDLAAEAYAESFLDELRHKPFDIGLLQHFASEVGPGASVLDLGCGPGHTTAHLKSLGLNSVGVDLSPEMVAKAMALFPRVDFAVGDFFQLSESDESIAGLLAFYCIVHLQEHQLLPAFNEMLRVLKPGGVLLLAFHVGTDRVLQDNFLDTGARLEFFALPVSGVHSRLLAAGFTNIQIRERPPYDTEYPTNRCYILAYKEKSA